MLEIRKSTDRGQANFGWLQSHHTFSFGNYYDPQQLGFSDLLGAGELGPLRDFFAAQLVCGHVASANAKNDHRH